MWDRGRISDGENAAKPGWVNKTFSDCVLRNDETTSVICQNVWQYLG